MHVLCRGVIWADKGTTLCIDCHLYAPWHKQVVLTQCPSITMCLCFCVSSATSIRASLSVSCSLVNSQSRISRLSTKQREDNFRNRCHWWVLSKDDKIYITGRSDVESLKNSISFLCYLFWRAAWTFTVWRSSLMPCSPLCPSIFAVVIGGWDFKRRKSCLLNERGWSGRMDVGITVARGFNPECRLSQVTQKVKLIKNKHKNK